MLSPTPTAALLPLAALWACAPSEQATAGRLASPDQELNVYIWTNYHSPAAITRFEALHGARVHVETYDNNEIIEQKLKSGQATYDVVVPSDYMVISLTRLGLLQPLDESLLPNLRNLDPAFDRLKADGGPRYSASYLWGTTGIAYRADRVKAPIESWSALFDPDYRGHIVMLDDMREAFGAALHTANASINSRDPAVIDAARRRLVEQRPLVLAYDSTGFAERLTEGEAWLVQGYSGELASVARASSGAIRYVVPREGCSITTDNLAIPASAPHIALAHAFIDYLLDPAVAAETTNYTGYATTNAAARHLVRPDLLGDPAVFPAPDALNRCEFPMDLGDFEPTLDAAWREIRAVPADAGRH